MEKGPLPSNRSFSATSNPDLVSSAYDHEVPLRLNGSIPPRPSQKCVPQRLLTHKEAMRVCGSALAACVAAWCVMAAVAQSTKAGQPPPPPPPPPPAPDSGTACSCTNSTLDCSSRGRSSLSASDRCSGPTTAVDLSSNRFVALPAAWGAHIVSVNASRNQLNALPRAPPLSANTRTLDLSFNQIGSSSDELRALAALETLLLRGNRLAALGFLPAPCNLRRLDASANRLRSLDGLGGCQKLAVLELADNQLASLPRGALAGLRKLKRLSLASAGLSGVGQGAFDGLKELEVLTLSANRLTALPSLVFSQLQELEQLHLDNNQLSALPADAFTGLKEVEVIDLNRNNLTSLPQGIFVQLSKLKRLNLRENRLRNLPRGIFSGLRDLEDIRLEANLLESVPSQLFAGLRSLQYIFLSGNKLLSVPNDLLSGVSPSLQALGLGGNRLTTLPAGLFRPVKSVWFLDLSLNRLQSLSGGDLAGLENVQRLELAGNRLTALPTYDASWPRVAAVGLEANGVRALGEAAARGWLGDGEARRRVRLGGSPWLRSPAIALASLRWALDEQKVMAVVAQSHCECGALKRGVAEISFCTDAACPGPAADWVEALRAARPGVEG